MIGNGHVQFCSGRRWSNLPPDRNRWLLEGHDRRGYNPEKSASFFANY